MRILRAFLVVLCLCPPALAQSPTRDWRPSDRTLIGDFSRITAVAAALERVYISSPSAVLIWRPLARQWEGPYDPPDPTRLTRVFSALVDPLDNSLWLARTDGWLHFQPELQLWDAGAVPEGILAIAFDATDPAAGLYFRTRTGWLLLSRGAINPTLTRGPARPVGPGSVDDAVRTSPTLRANAAQILLDPRLQSVQYTAAARSFDNRGWYLGTSGVGTLYLEDGAALPERLAFGLPSPIVGAVVGWTGGVWAATDRTPFADAALTFIEGDLREFRSIRGRPATGVPFSQIRKLVGQGTSLWAATDRGLARIETSGDGIQHLAEASGLPDSRVYAVVSRQGRITVGTAHGLVRVNDSLRVERLAPGYAEAAFAVFPVGDSVWVGTPRGLLLSLPDGQDLVRPAALAAASLQAPVVALASLGDTIVALTRDELLWRNPGTQAWTLGPNLSGLLGRLHSLAADGPGFWVAGDRGVGYARLNTPPVRSLREGDLPGVTNDVAVEGDYLWVATDGGLVRFRLDVIRP